MKPAQTELRRSNKKYIQAMSNGYLTADLAVKGKRTYITPPAEPQ
jgi:hypothetical protein